MRHRSPQSESGYILLAVIFMTVLILIALAVAAPRIAADIQRDREAELIHRGEQYKRAIKLYNKKFGGYPSSISQLENSNNIRFLRKRYIDPMTGKDDWKIIHLGEAHIKPMGLFGQTLQSSSMATTPGSSLTGSSGSSSSPTGSTSAFGGTTSSFGGTGSGFSSSPTSTNTGTDPSGTSGATGTTAPGSSSPFSSGAGTGSSTFGSSSGTSAFGNSGQTFGGAPMVGIASKNTKASIKEYKKQKHYNEWEFVYDPVEDMLSSVSLLGGGGSPNLNGANGTGTNGTTNPGTPTSPFGSGSSSGTGFGGGTFGNPPTNPTPTPTPTPQQPQQ
ncbi:type II secretion system protein [Alloacidobacterium dinghuense]|uniref:Type II secretion system protein n=1 Tax=Alloacidobacterium dinghuense TaxID=2763107 RepID=A0A7G8BCR7_9BACT|nr:type II secretion system protein [Alloacidobacterium dinghuense]QNI30337.1 type II secretion system protein [Alloacidobacterium dinghuense]